MHIFLATLFFFPLQIRLLMEFVHEIWLGLYFTAHIPMSKPQKQTKSINQTLPRVVTPHLQSGESSQPLRRSVTAEEQQQKPTGEQRIHAVFPYKHFQQSEVNGFSRSDVT